MNKKISKTIPEKYSKLYRVKYRNPSENWSYGIVDGLSEEAVKLWKKHKRLIVEDAISPIRYQIDPSYTEIVEIPFDYKNFGQDEYDKFVESEFEKSQNISDKAKTLVGKMFTMPVGDGCAYYVVVGETPRTAIVEWRGFCPDRWVDRTYGYKGSFPKKMIAQETKYTTWRLPTKKKKELA
jgi:hypothetical protein